MRCARLSSRLAGSGLRPRTERLALARSTYIRHTAIWLRICRLVSRGAGVAICGESYVYGKTLAAAALTSQRVLRIRLCTYGGTAISTMIIVFLCSLADAGWRNNRADRDSGPSDQLRATPPGASGHERGPDSYSSLHPARTLQEPMCHTFSFRHQITPRLRQLRAHRLAATAFTEEASALH